MALECRKNSHHERSSVSTAPFTILIAALGGEGGSVLMNWIVAAAREAGFAVQATSVPGVAQRTGSTSYYIELLPGPPPGAPEPVFALVPMPGRVDVVLASELVEAGRMMERGFVAPKRTTLITSTNRVITTAEKVHGGDGRHDPAGVEAAAKTMAKRLVALDLDALARKQGTLVSATLYGALASTGVLPWDTAQCAKVIGDAKSRAGFDAALKAAQAAAEPALPTKTAAKPTPANDPLGDLLSAGRARLIDYQDAAYADLFAQRVARLRAATDTADPVAMHALVEAARRLALWMAYEDVPRVADLKTRPERFERIRRESEAKPGQLITVVDYLKPGADEIAAMLPKRLGERLMRRLARGKSLPFVGRGIHLKATSIIGYTALRALAAFKRGRPGSLRYSEEQTAIEAWLGAMEQALRRSAPFASAVAELPRLLKGYADTHTRGRANYKTLFDGLVTPALAEGAEAATAQPLRKAIATALADPEAAATARLALGTSGQPLRA
jgi:indolepyruvate ferredoxin oxidoreductase, beta subunit